MKDHAIVINKHISTISNTSSILTMISCYSAKGGRYSSAQYMADRLNTKVIGFKGKVNKTRTATLSCDSESKTFTPQTSLLAKAITSIGYKVGYTYTKCRLYLKNQISR